jgi:hypothetical protein
LYSKSNQVPAISKKENPQILKNNRLGY